jgi:2-pyrone-4,6-dicarboxylate lactonase
MAAPAFTMDANWLCFQPNPSRPRFVLPPGSVDAHCHVFGPGDIFPYAPERKYTPCDASREQLFALRDFLGFERNVVVQATCHGKDNRAMIDVVRASNDRARGIATVGLDISDAEIEEMHEAGVRGVRFNFVRRLVDDTPREHSLAIAEKIARFGWHAVVYFEAQDLADLVPFIEELPIPVVIDHMGRPDIAAGVDSPGFDRFVQLMADNPTIWSKVTCPERLSVSGPPDYDDVVPFARKLVELFPDRVLWGTDWPHPNMTKHMPDDGTLVDFIPRIAPTAALQQALLVDNPMRLYWAK